VLPFPGDPIYDGLLFPRGTSLSLTAGTLSNGYATVATSFPIRIYEKTLSTVYLRTDGLVSENLYNNPYPYDDLSRNNADTGYFIAAAWAELDATNGGLFRHTETGVDSFTWVTELYADQTTPWVFQVSFFDTGNPYGVDPGGFAISYGKMIGYGFDGVTGISKSNGIDFLSPTTVVTNSKVNSFGYLVAQNEYGISGNPLYEWNGISYNLSLAQPPQVYITPPSVTQGSFTANECNGNTFNIPVTLSKEPTGDVNLTIQNGTGNNGTDVQTTALTFTPGNWNVPQNVTVTFNAINTFDTSTIEYISDDIIQSPQTSFFFVTRIPRNLVLTQRLTQSAGFLNYSVGISLSHPPVGTLNVDVLFGVSIGLTFDSSNWNIPQVVNASSGVTGFTPITIGSTVNTPEDQGFYTTDINNNPDGITFINTNTDSIKFSPTAASRGQTVTITDPGADFTTTNRVRVHGVDVNFTVVSTTVLTFVVGTHRSGIIFVETASTQYRYYGFEWSGC
jgi:hypothetical protein